MRFKLLSSFVLLVMTILLENTFAATYTITGDETWSGDRDFSGNGSAINGIDGSGFANSGTIATDGNITSNGNYRGVGVRDGVQIKFDNTSSGKQFQANNNKDATGTAGFGLSVYNGSTVVPQTILDIHGMNVEANNNWIAGIVASVGGLINIVGAGDGSNSLVTKGNKKETSADTWSGGTGIHVYDVNSANGYRPGINIKNMSVEASDNGYQGIRVNSGGFANIVGIANGTNTLVVNGNRNQTAVNTWDNGYGIIVNSTGGVSNYRSEMNIENMSVEVNNNGIYGILADNGGLINIVGVADGTNNLVANGNRNQTGTDTWSGGQGIITKLVSSSPYRSTINIENMSVETNNNGSHGIRANSGGLVYIKGVSSGVNKLQANGNRSQLATGVWGDGYGMVASDFTDGNRSTINITNMSVEANDNGRRGVHAYRGGLINIVGVADGTNDLVANGNRNQTGADIWTLGAGIYASVMDLSNTHRSEINIYNMSVETNNNGLQGVFVDGGGLVNIIGVMNGTNGLVANGNRNQTGLGVWSSGAGVHALGQNTATITASEINIFNMDIEANNNGLQGVYANSGGAVNIVGSLLRVNKLTANGNNKSDGTSGSGLVAEDNGKLNITNMNIVVEDNVSYGVQTQSAGSIKIVGNGNSFELKDNGVGMYSAGASSLIEVSGMNIRAGGNDVFQVVSDGSIKLDSVVVSVYDNSMLASFDDAIGNLTATISILNNQIVTVGTGVSNITFTDSIWNMKSDSNITDFTNSGSLVNLASANAGSYNTLTLTDYTASGDARVAINTFFDGDGTSTDKVVIGSAGTGVSSGLTSLMVNSTGHNGVATRSDGILVVDQSGALSAAAGFSLVGGVVDSGYWEYELYQGDVAGAAVNANNYYLRSNGRMTDIARTVTNLPAIHLNLIKTGMNELTKRMGELREGTNNHENGLWVRSYGRHMNVNEKISSDLDIFGMEAGYDHKVYQSCDNVVFVGLMSGILYSGNIRTTADRGQSVGEANANTPSVGVYGTWMNREGWFADAAVRHFWSNMNARNTTSAGDVIKYEPDREFTAASLEFGRQFEVGSFRLEPKVEAQYSIARADRFGTSAGTEIKYGETQSFVTKAAASLGHRTKFDNGMVVNPYIQAGVLQEWDGKTNIEYANHKYDSNQSGFGYEIGGGLNLQVDSNTAFYGQVMYENGEVIESVNVNAGVRVNF